MVFFCGEWERKDTMSSMAVMPPSEAEPSAGIREANYRVWRF